MSLVNEYFRVVEKVKTGKKQRSILSIFIRWMHLVMKGEMENTYTIE